MAFKIAVLPGDGIGPEVTAEAVACLEVVARRFGLTLELTEGLIGGCAIDAEGTALPAKGVRLASAAKKASPETKATRVTPVLRARTARTVAALPKSRSTKMAS